MLSAQEGSNQTPDSAPDKKNKTLVIILSAVGGLIVLVSLILTLVLVSSRDDSTGGDVSEESNSNEEQQPQDINSDLNEAGATSEGSTAPSSLNTDSSNTEENVADGLQTTAGTDNNPNVNFISSFNLERLSNIGEASESEVNQIATEYATERQAFIDQFESIGYSESDVEDFMLAYDQLMSESVLQKISAEITDQESADLSEQLSQAVNNYLYGIFSSCDLAVGADYTCIIEAINVFGREITAILQDSELI